MTVRWSQPRRRSGGSRLVRLVIALVLLAVAAFGALTVYRDVRDDRALSSRGVTVTGQLADKGCLLCKAVSVDFTTTTGQKVSAVVSAIGPQADRTISLRYDPKHPTTVHPAHGVRFDLERPNSPAAPWTYRGFAFTHDARFALEVLVTGEGEVRVSSSDAAAPADLAEKTRLLFRALYKQSERTRDGAPPRKVVRWRGEK